MNDPFPSLRFGDVLAFRDGGLSNPIAWRIRAKTNGWCNHVGLMLDPVTLSEATFGAGLHTVGLGEVMLRQMVVLRPHNYLGYEYVFTEAQRNRVLELFTTEQGSGYDWRAIAGWLFGASATWQSDEQWFCSEWVTAAMAAAGFDLLNGTLTPASVSPTGVAACWRLRPIWYRLPPAVSRLMNLDDVPHDG